MTNAFSALSLKRNRSTNKSFSSSHTTEPVTKLSKLKSGFSIFSKKLLSHTHYNDTNSSIKATKRSSASFLMIGLFQYFRSNDHRINKSSNSSSSITTDLKRKATFDSDTTYEYNHYFNRKKNMVEEESNQHTLPITVPNSKLTSILIKRIGTNTSYPQQSSSSLNQHQYSSSLNKANSTISARRKRSWSNATISNMTINSEDLTAKEFANIAGIRILPEDDDYLDDQEEAVVRKYNDQEDDDDEEEDFIMHTASSRYTTPHDRLSFISYTSLASHSTGSKLKIWDNEFWLNPEQVVAATTASRSNNTNKKESEVVVGSVPSIAHHSLEGSSSVTIATTTKKTVMIDDEPSILHELRRINSERRKEHYVIKKGRFEIQLGATFDIKNNDEAPRSSNIVTLVREDYQSYPSTSSVTFNDVNTTTAVTIDNTANVILR